MKISENFDLGEFQKGAQIPLECYAAFAVLARRILEPVRAQFNEPIEITSGYRDAGENAAAHGQPNSEHMATMDQCAADFICDGFEDMRPVFDWMRNSPDLPFHQLILEHGRNGSTIIHVSWNAKKPGERHVLEGATNNAAFYTQIDHVPFAGLGPTAPPTDGSSQTST
jgi:hypothetical protein